MSYTLGSGDQMNNDSSIPLHRIARRGNLASHMSKVCKKKIDAFQAKFSKVEKTRHEPRQKTKWIPKQGGYTNNRSDISHGKKYHISKMKAKLTVLHNQNSKIRKMTASKHGLVNTETSIEGPAELSEKDPLSNDVDAGKSADEVVSVKKEPMDDNAERADEVVSVKKEPMDDNVERIEGPAELSGKDPLSNDVDADKRAGEDVKVKEEPMDDIAERAGEDVKVKEEPMDDIAENYQDDSGEMESLASIEYDDDYMEEEALIEMNLLDLEEKDTEYMEEEALIEKDPLALDDKDTDFYEEKFCAKKDPLALDIKREDDPDSSSANNNHSYTVKLSNIKVEEDKKHCIYCGFSTTLRKKLVRHMKLQHFGIESCVNSNFISDSFHQVQHEEDCFNCFHSSSFNKNHKVLRNHMGKHENKDSFSSDEVKSNKMSKINKKHIKINADEKNRFDTTPIPVESVEKNSLVICPYCEFRTDEPQKIISHLLTEHKKNLSCSLCSYQTPNPEELRWHINHEHLTLHECTNCNYKTGKWLEFQEHTVTKHIFYCTMCKFKANKLYNLEDHIIFRHTSKVTNSFLCTFCSKFKSDDAREMVYHIIAKHETKEQLYKKIRPRKYKVKLLKELKRASLKVVHKCRYCFFESFDTDGYINHLALNHMKKPPIQCVYCEFTALEFIELAQHITDEGLKKEGNFFCNKCHYSTTQLETLKIHLRERDHISKEYCSFCNYSTCHLELLNLHIQTKHKKTISSYYQTKFQEAIANQSTIEIDDSSQNYCSPIDQDMYNVNRPMVEYVFQCSNCHLFTSSKEELLEHIHVVHKGITVDLTEAVQYSLSQETQQLQSENNLPKEYEDVHCCSYCDYESTDFLKVKLHIATVHNEKIHFYCKFSFCSFMAANIDQLKHHIKFSHVREMFSCVLCHYSTGVIKVFEEHMELVHNVKLMFTCCKCSFKTKDFKTLQSHVKSAHEDKDIVAISFPNTVVISKNNYLSAIGQTERFHTCSYCNFYTTKTLLLSLHVSTKHKGLNIFFCNYCDFYFTNFETLEKHVSSEHSVWRRFTCPLCSVNSWSLKDLWDHVGLNHKMDFLFECSHCTAYKAETSEELQEHVMEEHAMGKKSVQISFSCPLCDNLVSNVKKLFGHIITEHTTVDFLCSYCSFKTNEEGLLQYHSITKHKKGISIGFCSVCGFDTCDFSKLRAHLVEKHNEFQGNNDRGKSVISNHLYKLLNVTTNLQEDFYFVCSDCGYKATATNEYYQHILMYHVDGISSTTNLLMATQNKTVDSFQTVRSYNPIRPKVTPGERNITSEVEKSGENKIKFCSLCDFGTDDLQELLKHYRSEHKGSFFPLNPKPGEKYENVTGSKSILSSPKTGHKLSILSSPKTKPKPIILKNISSFHRRKGPFSCFKCGLTYDSLENLKSHMEDSHKVVFYLGCKVHNCKFKTSDQNLLQQHLKTSHMVDSSSTSHNKTPGINLENTELQIENSSRFKAVTVNPGYSILNKPKLNEYVIASPMHPAEAKKIQYTIMLEHNGKKVPVVSKTYQPKNKSHVVMRSTSSSSLQHLTDSYDASNISANN